MDSNKSNRCGMCFTVKDESILEMTSLSLRVGVAVRLCACVVLSIASGIFSTLQKALETLFLMLTACTSPFSLSLFSSLN